MATRTRITQAGQKYFRTNGSGTEVDPYIDSMSITDELGTEVDFATEAKQDELLAELQLKADLTETQPVSAASLPLPTGASTESTQDELKAEITTTQNELLNNILMELRKANTHLAQITDEEIKEEDVICL